MARYEVIGDSIIAGKSKGETVDLDETVNVDALLWGGHIKPVAKPKAKPEPEPVD